MSVEAAEIASSLGGFSGSPARAIPDVSTALLLITSRKRGPRYRESTAGAFRLHLARDPSPQSRLHKLPDRP